jgi:predicted RNase H-like nuclease (RuvC/YqgF family)
MEPWQQWATAAVTFLSGLAAVWATLRSIRRKDRAQDAHLGREGTEEEEQGQENAAAQCWKFARMRERWYSEERKTFLLQLRTKDDLVEELRKEVHGARDAWSEEQLKRIRLEETVKYLRAELESRSEGRPEHPPPHPAPPDPGVGGT